MKNILNRGKVLFCRTNYKFLFAIITATVFPFLYSWLRIFWIIDQGETAYALSSFQVYIQLGLEALSAFILIPLLVKTKDEQKNKNLSLLLSVLIILFLFSFLFLAFLKPLVNSMEAMNPISNRRALRIFVIISIYASISLILEKYLLINLAVEGKISTLYLFTAISLLIQILLDFILFSSWALIPFSIDNIAISSLISSWIIISFLLILWFKEYIQTNRKTEEKFISRDINSL